MILVWSFNNVRKWIFSQHNLTTYQGPVSSYTNNMGSCCRNMDSQEKKLIAKATQGHPTATVKPKLKFKQEMPSGLLGKSNPHIYVTFL